MSVYNLKPAFQGLLRPMVGRLAAIGVTANQVTLAAAVLSLATGVALWWAPVNPRLLLTMPVVLLVRMALNAVDGMLAREHHQASALGAVLNELGDVVSDAALYLPFAVLPGMDGTAVVAVVVLAGLTEMTGVVAVQIGASRRYDGPMGKSDRAVVLSLVAILLGVGLKAGLWTTVILWVVVGLLVTTVVNRVRGALREVEG